MPWEAAAIGCEAAMLHDDARIGYSSEQSTILQEHKRGGAKRRACQLRGRVVEAAEEEEVIDELCNDDNSAEERKRRLTSDQVEYLEMSFMADLKLEPQRKALIAKHLGIRPRQVAIWFQNRRARWKNKQLEQDFEVLKATYEGEMKEKEKYLKEHQLVLEENQKLQAEVARLNLLLQGTKASIALKEEELSGKSEVASPTTTKFSSDAQSEMQDSGQSHCATSVVAEDQAFDLNPSPVLPCVKLEPDSFLPAPSPTPAPATDDAFGSLVQRLISNGFDLEIAYHLFNYEEDLKAPWITME